MPGNPPPSLLGRASRALAAPFVVLLARLYRVYHRTLRVHVELPDGTVIGGYAEYRSDPEVFALCERDAIALGGLVAGEGVVTLVARGLDGDWASRALEALGYEVVRGASGRGGAGACRQLVRRLVTTEDTAAIVVDGPLGPAGEAKPGVLFCAALTGRPVRPLAAAARPALVFGRAWSKLYVPLPFARLAVTVADHVTVADASPPTRRAAAGLLNDRLAHARRRALEINGGR